jgi:hypothetical protein
MDGSGRLSVKLKACMPEGRRTSSSRRPPPQCPRNSLANDQARNTEWFCVKQVVLSALMVLGIIVGKGVNDEAAMCRCRPVPNSRSRENSPGTSRFRLVRRF